MSRVLRATRDVEVPTLIAGGLVVLLLAGFLIAFSLMVLIGAFLSYREYGFSNPGYWEVFFGMWLLVWIGRLFNGGVKQS